MNILYMEQYAFHTFCFMLVLLHGYLFTVNGCNSSDNNNHDHDADESHIYFTDEI